MPAIRLLIVDDNSDDRVLALRVLQRHFPELQAFEADDRDSLDARLADWPYDAVVTDYSLGFSDGIRVLEAIRARDAYVPVIMFTITGSEEICAEGMKKGLFDYILKKPESYARLPIAIQSGIDLARTKAQLAARERELQERAAQLAEANKRKDEFLAMLAHELRNPLAPLRNGVAILRLKAVEPTLTRVGEMMERQVAHLARLVNDLLDMSRVNRGRVELRSEQVDLAALVRTIVDDRRATYVAAGVSLHVDIASGPMWVQGDPARLTQTVDNLLDNAVKFNNPGGTVRVALRGDGDEARLTVSDTGIGIAAEIVPHIFEVFAQADRSLDRRRGGLGIGLALAKRFVDLHGGSIQAQSDGVGQGATFTILLPLHHERPALVAGSTPLASGSPLRILVIEDNEDAAESLRALLELLGHAVDVAASGDAGLKLALEREPDAIVCDIGLPGMDGYSVARALRAHARTRAVRLIALTGYGHEENRREARAAGFDDHLVKPVHPQELLRALERSPRDE